MAFHSPLSFIINGRACVFPDGVKRFSVFQDVKTSSRAHQALYPVGTLTFSPGIRRPCCDDCHLAPYHAEVKNVWVCTSTTHNLHVTVLK